MNWLCVLAGAAIGAPLRYLTDRGMRARFGAAFPWGTFAVNVAGSFVLGVVTGVAGAASPHTQLFLGTGLCGALTTYSTFGYETSLLAEGRMPFAAVANVVGSVAAGLGAAFLGVTCAEALWG
ncbi:fluoride efflux transporter CrcB [Streptomyces lasiicapitis]|uniref:Fluoride-specific ion channel FluC n=1 Tax=Streptomyces lasiicapitis TaxID=1923961 RepID=A0ABQ2M6K5_9ACTN|nr:fluoride efflux transporter CrcB [Streptomyces lasiicapitis]GGO47840.1 putative fluoride ion transporter CrcB 2 [Streptomyces lasiicapitis]